MHRATLAAIIEQLVNAAETNIRVLCALRPSAPPFDSQDPESIIRGLPRDCLQNFNQRSWERWGDSTDPDSCAQKCLKLWRATTQLKQELKRSPAIALKTVLKPGESLTVEKGGGEPGEFTLEIYPRVLELRGQGKKWDFVVKQINREFRTNYKDENLQRQYRRVKNKPKTPR